MTAVTILWSMIASACLTLAAICWLVWYRNRTASSHLLFSVSAGSSAALALCELWTMHAATGAALDAAMRWSQVPACTWLLSSIWFARAHLRAGRDWLAWTACGLWTVSLVGAFVVGPQVVHAGNALRQAPLFGARITLPGAGYFPWPWAGHLAVALGLVFLVDVSVSSWRRGDRRKAPVVGGSLGVFLLAVLVTTLPVLWGGVPLPMVFGPPAMALVAVMGYELNRDVLRASHLLHDLRESDADLREHEARMASAVDAADFGIWIRDLSRNQLWASERWRQLFQFSPSDLLTFEDLLRRVHPEDRETVRQAQARAVATAHDRSYHTEYRLLLPDGAVRWISSWGRVEVDEAGIAVLVRGASQDISARKASDQQMQSLRHEMAHTGRVALMGQLASALTHEIHQPLAAMLRNAEAGELLLQQPSPDIDQVQSILTDIRHDDARAGAVIDRMRQLLRRQPMEPRQLDVRTLVTDVVALVRVDAARRQIRLDVDVPPTLPQVTGDRVHLQQVLLNLLVNGMDALDGIAGHRRRLAVTARLDAAQHVETAVDDGGAGIAAEDRAHVFEPLFTTKANGMGMGLTIPRSIVEAHGGRLWVEQGSEGGSVFRFTLPTARSGEARAAWSDLNAPA